MTSKVVNLRQARKQRERAARRQEAEANRRHHGRTRAEREQAARDAEAKARHLDGHWLDRTEPEAGTADKPERDGS